MEFSQNYNWGKDLWDQFENISIHTQKGIEFCEKFYSFIKERCLIENEYASKIKKLTKSYQCKKKEDENDWSTLRSFCGLITEVHDLAGQHEVIADNLANLVLKDLQLLIQQVKQDRKKYISAGTKQQNSLQVQISLLEKSRRSYEKSFKDSEKAQDIFKKADQDIHMSKADVEKARTFMTQKQQYCEECKNEYAAELQKTNESQQQHYFKLMPLVFEQIQDVEEKRIIKIQDMIRKCASVERDVIPIINTCIIGIDKAADAVNYKEDSKQVIDKLKSGFEPPTDLQFEDLDTSPTASLNSAQSTPQSAHNTSGKLDYVRNSLNSSMRGKRKSKILNLFSGSKTENVKEDFSHLPPNQQKKKLNQKIDSIRTTLAKDTAERDGMLKMQDVYKQNSSLGDPASLSKQLEENGVKLDKLRLELQKYENYLKEADGQATYIGRSVSKVNSASWVRGSFSSPIKSTNTPISNNGTSSSNHNRVSNNRTSSHSANDGDSFDDMDDGNEVDVDNDDESDAVIYNLGTCVALFPFQALSEGSIPMSEGDEFLIIEHDQGDGWMRVRRANGEEGFVPTSYVECQPPNNVS